jgi:hypothetical protein
MLWSERCVRNHKRETDCAISRTYTRLAAYPDVLASFVEILQCVRTRARRLFEAPVVDGHHLGIEALVHLARFRAWHIRAISDWDGTASSWRAVVSALAHHLVCTYRVPVFLASSWCSCGEDAERHRFWFAQHGRGASFRSLDLPMAMTRRMERIFLASQDHLSIEHALRRAELLALNAPAAMVDVVMKTRLANDMRNGAFWRSFWIFLIGQEEQIGAAQIGPLIDYLQAMRHEPIRLDTPHGAVMLDPPQPAFSMKGRTTNSMLRLMRGWHQSLGSDGAYVHWPRSPFAPLLFDEPAPDPEASPRRWHMVELTNSAQLHAEGRALRHCVAIYAHRCHRGFSSIWSLRLLRGEAIHHVLTIEIDPRRRAVIQARGFANRMPTGKYRRILQVWASRERLSIAC